VQQAVPGRITKLPGKHYCSSKQIAIAVMSKKCLLETLDTCLMQVSHNKMA